MLYSYMTCIRTNAVQALFWRMSSPDQNAQS